MTQIHAGHRRRFAPGERQIETELFGVEIYSGWNVADEQGRVVLLAVYLRGGWIDHGALHGTEQGLRHFT